MKVEKWDKSAFTPEEQAEWDEFTRENPEASLDEIDAKDPDDYYPLPQPKKNLEEGMSESQKAGSAVSEVPSWGGLGKKGEEYGQKLLEYAVAIRTEREEIHRAGPPQHSVGSYDPYILSIGKEIDARIMSQKTQVYELGYLFCLAKQRLKHGEFLPWLKQFSLSRTSALNNMRIYRACAGQPELIRGFSRIQLNTLCAPAFPRTLRNMIFAVGPNNVPSDAAQIVALGRKFQNSPLPLQEPEIVRLFAHRAHEVAYRFLERELRELWRMLDLKVARLERIIREETPEAFAVTDGVERKCYQKVINLFKRFAVKLEEVELELNPEPEEEEEDEPTEAAIRE